MVGATRIGDVQNPNGGDGDLHSLRGEDKSLNTSVKGVDGARSELFRAVGVHDCRTASFSACRGGGEDTGLRQEPFVCGDESSCSSGTVYLTKELPDLVFKEFSEIDGKRVSISGHSMGGHGALTLYLKNPGKYKSVSAFAPIANPLKAPWGEKAFKGYFGDADWESKGAEHDSTELLKKWKGGNLDILIDVVRIHWL